MDQHPTDDLSVTGHGFPHGYLSPHRNLIREIALTAFFLGVMGAFSVYLILHALLVSGSVVEYALGWYILASGVVFHMAEFLVAVSMRRHDTHPDAFMLLHSPEFLFAMAASYVEFGIEVYLIPEHWKLPVRTEWGGIAASLFRLTSFTQVTVAAVITLAFYGIRVVGLFHCGTNFSLIIESKRRANHNLVVDGIYAWLRHPAYFGWFWRTVVSQWVLMNPICFVGFTIVTWKFFASRIPFEEQLLASDAFFGTTYDAYMSTTIVGIPFIRSWKRQASSVKRD